MAAGLPLALGAVLDLGLLIAFRSIVPLIGAHMLQDWLTFGAMYDRPVSVLLIQLGFAALLVWTRI